MRAMQGVVLLAASVAALPSVAGIFKREDSMTSDSAQRKRDPDSTGWIFITTTYVQTDLQTVTQTISSYMSESSSAPPICKYSEGQTQCGPVCCSSSQYCVSDGQCAAANPSCPNPCGWQGQLCCAADEVCITDANNQAQCRAASPDNGTTCGLSTTVYTTTQTYESTILETITMVVTRIEQGVEVVTRTASFAVSPICAPALDQIQCGTICCLGGQFCQAPGTCLSTACPPVRPTSNTLGVGVTTSTVVTTTIPFEPPLRPTTDSLSTNDDQSAGSSTTETFVQPVATG